MSGVTKGQLEVQNAELLQTVKRLEKMNSEAMALARRARNDTDDSEREARHFKEQRDRLVGYIEGNRPDRDRGMASGGVVEMARPIGEPRPERTRVDDFLDAMRREPDVRDGASRPYR